ncbi:hypothetical protein DL93DRAFT_2091639, partial [Clavulina sp. PMI_390]
MNIWTVVRRQRSLDPAIIHIVLLECCLPLASEYHLSVQWMLALPAATAAVANKWSCSNGSICGV